MDDKRDWKRKWTLLGIVCLVDFSAWACFALLAPFFPQEAALKGVSTPLIGFIFGVYELVVFIASPLLGLVVHIIGCKFMFISGVFVCGTCSILFGLLDHSPPGEAYIALCLLTRIIQALGAAAFLLGGITLVTSEFPEKVTFIVAIVETCCGVGLMVGPVIGGVLYNLGGYGLPFYVMGGILVSAVPLTYMMLNSQTQNNNEKEERVSMRKLVCNTSVLVVALSTMISSFGLAFLDPILANRLTPLGLTPLLIGLVFVLSPGLYAISTPIWGWIGDKYKHVYIYLVFCNLACCVCFILLGPAPFLGLPYTLWLILLCLALMGVCVGGTFIMSYRGFIDISLNLGFEQNTATFGCLTGIFNSAMSLGAFLGPTVSGILDHKLDFELACFVCALLFLPVSLLSLIQFFILPKCYAMNRMKSQSNGHISLVSSWAPNERIKLKYSDTPF